MSRSRQSKSGSKPAKKRPNKQNSSISGNKKGKKERRIREEMTGTVIMSREGYAFISVEGREDDIFVPARKMHRALNGDTVLVSVLSHPANDKKAEGEVIKIIERSKRPHIGILQVVGSIAWVITGSKNMPYDIRIEAGQFNPDDNGKKVAVIVKDWTDDDPVGEITAVLGAPGENNTEMHAILTEFGLPYEFAPEIEAEAAKISGRITKKEISQRRDYRDVCTFTIDPKDAKDFDDAVSLMQLPDGNWEVGVHIADVTHFVKPGSLIDKEAYERGTSVYLVDRTVPMLPEKLSNKLCSLRPDETKLTFSAIFKMDDKANVLSSWFGRTVIKSDYRFDYDGAQAIIKGEDGPYKEQMLKLWELASQLRKRRFDAGAISFERPEMKIEVDRKGRPINIVQKVTFEANWLIEEFMLLANKKVAEEVSLKLGLKDPTFVYRIHEQPDIDKVGNLRSFIHHFGYTMGRTDNPKELAKELNTLLGEVKGKPEAGAIEILALRTMARARYSTDNVGHYGLGFDYYTHFTSPIRRYPDMMVHRLLAHYLEKGKPEKKSVYEDKCKYASQREQLATEAERASIKYKMVEYMQDKVGNIYEGTISGVTEWGIFVELDETKVEGMVSLRDIRDDYFEFNEEEYCVRSRSTGRTYRLGDRVKIRVSKANLEQKLLDYELIIEDQGNHPEALPSGTGNHEKPTGKARKAGSKTAKEKDEVKKKAKSAKGKEKPEKTKEKKEKKIPDFLAGLKIKKSRKKKK